MLQLVILSLSQSVSAWVFDCSSVAFKHPEHQHLDPERQTSWPALAINKYRSSLFFLCDSSGGPGGRVNGGHSRAPEKSVTRCDHRQLPICGWWPVSLAQFALSHVELKSGCGGLHTVQCTGVSVATQDTSNPVELRLVTQTVWAKPRRWQRVWDTIDSHL